MVIGVGVQGMVVNMWGIEAVIGGSDFCRVLKLLKNRRWVLTKWICLAIMRVDYRYIHKNV